MIRINRVTDYGIVLMSRIALARDAGPRTARELAAETGLPFPMVSKVLKALARGALLESQRGTHGGYRLRRDPGQISVADMIFALQGPIAIAECATGHAATCGIESNCSCRGAWQRINDALTDTLQSMTLSEMAGLEPGPHPDAPPSAAALRNAREGARPPWPPRPKKP